MQALDDSLFLLLLMPLASALLCGFLHAALRPPLAGRAAGIVASLAAFAALFLTIRLCLSLEPGGALVAVGLPWIQTGALEVGFDLRLDTFSALLLPALSGVSALIHLYACGSLSGERGAARFFAYLALASLSATLLVLGDNLLLLFAGWQGLSLTGWLLIGFRTGGQEGQAPALAGMKMFLVQRIGDAAFLLGLFLLLVHCGTLAYGPLEESVAAGALARGSVLGERLALTTALCLFVGAACKAGLIPFTVWLQGAGAAPTPAAALLQTVAQGLAGLYAIARVSFILDLSPGAMGVIALTGALSALIAAAMAAAQRDPRKLLALSTASQFGLMFLACGAGGPLAALDHAAAHAFFKALLILGVGALLCAPLGGLDAHSPWRRLPLPCALFFVGTLCMAGLPPLSGFFTLQELLWQAARHGTTFHALLYILGACAALLTAYYTFRLFSLVMLGAECGAGAADAPSSVGPAMTLALTLLALPAAAWAYLRLPELFSEPSKWFYFLLGAGLAGAGSWAGRRFSSGSPPRLEALAGVLAPPPRRGLHLDQACDVLLARPLGLLSRAADLLERHLFEALAEGTKARLEELGELFNRIQDGRLSTYAAWVAAGVVALGLIVLVGVLR